MAKISYWLAVIFLFIPAALCCLVLLAVTFPLFILTTVSSMSFTSLRLFVTVLLRNAKQKKMLREDELISQVSIELKATEPVEQNRIKRA